MLALRTPEGNVVPAQTKSWPLAQATAVGQRSYWRPESSLNFLGGGSANYDQLYWSQPWVQTVINKLTRSVARLPLKTYELNSERNMHERPNAVPAKILRNPYDRAGAFQLKEFIMGSLCVWGNATLVKFRGGNGQTPNELWPMPFQRVTVIEGKDRPIIAYQYSGSTAAGSVLAKPLTFLPEDVIHFSWFNPDGHPWGRSPLEALSTTLALENAGQRYALAHFGNNARPASFLVSEAKLTKEQRENLRVEIEAAYGGPDNAFKVALLDNGLDWKPISGSMRDTTLIENRKLSREEVCAVYDVPPPLVGILDNATYSNISEQHIMLYMDTIAPILSMLEDTGNAQFMNEPAWANLELKFDMSEVVRGDYDKRTQGQQRQFMSAQKTPNELRMDNGDSPHGDINDEDNPANWLYIPVNTAPITGEGVLQPIQATKPPATDPPPAEPAVPAEKPAAKKKPAAAATATKARKPTKKSQIDEMLALQPPEPVAA